VPQTLPNAEALHNAAPTVAELSADDEPKKKAPAKKEKGNGKNKR